jgi:hypothetical protein
MTRRKFRQKKETARLRGGRQGMAKSASCWPWGGTNALKLSGMVKVVFAFQPGWAAFSLGMQHDVVLYQIATVARSTLHFALLITPLHLCVQFGRGLPRRVSTGSFAFPRGMQPYLPSCFFHAQSRGLRRTSISSRSF